MDHPLRFQDIADQLKGMLELKGNLALDNEEEQPPLKSDGQRHRPAIRT